MKNTINSGKILPLEIFLEHLLQRLYSVDPWQWHACFIDYVPYLRNGRRTAIKLHSYMHMQHTVVCSDNDDYGASV